MGNERWLRWLRLPELRHVLLPPSALRVAVAVAVATGGPAAIALAVGHQHRGLAAFGLLAVTLAAALVGRFAAGATATLAAALAYVEWFAAPSGELRATDVDATILLVCVSLLVSLIAGLQQAAFASVERQSHDFEAAAASLKELLDGVGAIVWRSDPEFRVSFAGQSAERLLGVPPERIVADPRFWLDHVHPDDRDRVVADARARMAVDDEYEHEYRLVAADGRELWFRNIVRVSRDDAGRPRELRGILVDVSEAKRLEEQLRQSQKMEAIGQLAGGVAHDFNNLLTVIVGHVALVLRDRERVEPRLRAELEAVEKAAARAAGLTQQLLAFSRKQVLRPAVVDLNEVVVSIDGLLRRTVGEHVVLRTIAAPDAVPVRADRTQIEQVLVNLALNARDAMPAGGELRFEVAAVELDEVAAAAQDVTPGAYARLLVADDGYGMDEPTRASAFDPFFTTKPPGKGSGLGLSTAYGIVRQTGGAISVATAPGEGATFTILLPRAAAAPAEAQPEREPERGPEPATAGAERDEVVLLVEDEELVRSVVAEMLATRGYRVVAAADAGEAEAAYDEHGCDALVTDVVMPGASGVELARRLVARRPDLKVLFLSGYTRDAFPLVDEVAATSAFLQKPFTIDELGRALEELLSPWPPAPPPASAAPHA